MAASPGHRPSSPLRLHVRLLLAAAQRLLRRPALPQLALEGALAAGPRTELPLSRPLGVAAPEGAPIIALQAAEAKGALAGKAQPVVAQRVLRPARRQLVEVPGVRGWRRGSVAGD